VPVEIINQKKAESWLSISNYLPWTTLSVDPLTSSRTFSLIINMKNDLSTKSH